MCMRLNLVKVTKMVKERDGRSGGREGGVRC